MPTFTLTIFEQTGSQSSTGLRLLGERQLTASTLGEAKSRLSQMLAEGRLESDRFYRFESSDCPAAMGRDVRLNVAFYLFPDGRLCPLRIWERGERVESHRSDPDWVADFEGIPGWAFIASIEPRWRCLRTVPAERSWMGRSKRDWQKRDCYVLGSSAAASLDCAA